MITTRAYPKLAGGGLRGAFFLLVWAVLASSASCAKAQGGGLVYLKVQDVRVSSFDDSPGGWAPPANSKALVDGDLKTRWSSKAENGQWAIFNFGRPKVVSSVVLHWERAFASSYALDFSDDGKAWKRVCEKKGQGGTERSTFKPTTAAYMRVYVLKRGNDQWGVSLWEVEPYGPSDRNPGEKPLGEVFPWRTSPMEQETVAIKAEKPLPSPGPIAPAEFQRGVNYTSWHETELGLPVSDQILRYLRDKGVGHVAILITWFQADTDSTDIHPLRPEGPRGGTPTDNALKHALNMAHSLGLKVMLKPHLDLEDGTYRGDLFPKKGWFPSYAKFIKYYARMAKDFNVEMFSVGVELKGATTWEQEKNWRELIHDVRKIYPGPLTYAANWDEYYNVAWWDALDYIGIDAYFPLTDNYDAPLPALESGWNVRADEIETWLEKKGLKSPVIFTEVGYPSVKGANVQPWVEISDVPDRREQADCFTAAFEVLTKRPWFHGFYWWHYFPRDRPVVEDLTIRGKLAEEVMTNWFKKLSNNKGDSKQ